MTTQPRSHRTAEAKNRMLWDRIAPVHLDTYKKIEMLREGTKVPPTERRLSSCRSCLRAILAAACQEEGHWA